MLNTALCDILGIDVPIILAPMGTCTSAEFAAAVSNEGGLGGIGSLFRTTAAVKRDIDLVKTLTNKPYAVNHIPQTLDAEVFRHTLAARPAVISFALGDPGDLVRQAHDVGSRVMLQGMEAIAQANSEDAIKVDVLNDISPLPGTAGFGTVLRSLHTAFVDEWSAKRDEACRDRDRLRNQIISTTQAGRPHETLLTAGQTAGGIKQILPVAVIMRQLIAEAEAALSKAPKPI
jgi:NAD(P)H-dependent flavin oxidoreductase YrpB (nitropropane dioxygenase family)